MAPSRKKARKGRSPKGGRKRGGGSAPPMSKPDDLSGTG